MTMRREWLEAAFAVAVLLSALVGVMEREQRADGGNDGALLEDRWRIRLTSAQVAEEVSEQGYAQRLDEYRARDILDNDPYLTELVGSVAEPLIIAAKDLYPRTADWAWEWHFADTGEINAYCMPGGRIVVLSGLLSDKVLGDDRAMLATILAHEVSHAILQHTRESMGRGWVAQGLAWTVAKSLKIGGLREQEMVRGLKSALLDPNNRKLESEADVLGLELMARAGFDPAKAVATWERMAQRRDASLQGELAQQALAFLSDHPSDAERLDRMKQLQPKAEPLAVKGKRWEWTVQGINDQQVETLDKAAAAFGLGTKTFSVTEHSEVAKTVAKTAGLSSKAVAEELDKALWETGLSQGGVIQMALTAMVRGVGGWERLARIEQAWSRQGLPRSLYQDPSLVGRLNLTDEDRAYALNGVKRVEGYLNSEQVVLRLWRDVADEVAKTQPKVAGALRRQLEAGNADASGRGQ